MRGLATAMRDIIPYNAFEREDAEDYQE